ncbi:Ser/Thr protein phosphatase family [Drechmeria coniospora]|uniref:Ser/Thr protein phosphatase family n=1 Tax=Drechmeria coniospora TaxID=98403 RepID=A0A151GLX6_DRECN|nr:Ser/Thr protein phosphatase family [Drechmeria coniospora]KYK58115.1 Ser/Thr protein phosphatase family [Drechmeria coniospora]
MLLPRPLLAFAALGHAAQPGAVKPVAAPMRDLTWGQLNFLHTTDTHGWLGGHMREPQYSADWGDYISFSNHLRKRADDAGTDLLLVDTGDRIEGNGLYDASTPKGLFQYDIYAQQHVDIICIGNHELYQAYSADREHNTTVPNFKHNYIASNLDYVDSSGRRKPLAQRYRRFKTKNQKLDIIAFGFLFDFTGNANNSVVQPVAETVKEPWFQEAMRQKPDLFVVIGHVGLRMEEFRTIFTALRKQNWHIPIIFFGGHAHVRDALSYDAQSISLASGRYMETVGWLSVDGLKPKSASASASSSVKFSRKYIDNNLYGMHYHTGLNETTFPTEEGVRVSGMISRARKSLQLDEQYGCAPKDLWLNRAKYPGKDSIYSWIQDEVFPDIIVNETRKSKPRLALMNTGGMRFDIFKGPFTRDSAYLVNPFINRFNYVADVPYEVAKKVLGILNSAGKVLNMDMRYLTIPEQMFLSVAETQQEAPETHREARIELRSEGLIAGYTTNDDIGTDGDDTVHKPISFHAVPNCVQSEINFPDGQPATVDVVFIDFLTPWIIPALKFSGGDYSEADVHGYMEGTLMYKLAEWIKTNWKC